MRRRHRKYIAAFLALLLLAGCAWWGLNRFRSAPGPVGAPTSVPDAGSWTNLLDETHVRNWRNVTDEKKIFEIANGQLHIFGRSVYPLRYVGYMGEMYSDFELHLEFRLEDGANSGVFLRATPNDPVYRGFEVQILDDYGKPPSKNGSGAIYDVVTPMFNMARPAGEWNSLDIRVRGRHVVVVMNGWKVVDTNFSEMTEPFGKFPIAYAELPQVGHILLQDHGGEIWFRNIYVRALSGDTDAAN